MEPDALIFYNYCAFNSHSAIALIMKPSKNSYVVWIQVITESCKTEFEVEAENMRELNKICDGWQWNCSRIWILPSEINRILCYLLPQRISKDGCFSVVNIYQDQVYNTKRPGMKMWVGNLKWPCVKLEVVVKVGGKSEMGQVVKVDGKLEVGMGENGSDGQNGWLIGNGHVLKWKWWSKLVHNPKWWSK